MAESVEPVALPKKAPTLVAYRYIQKPRIVRLEVRPQPCDGKLSPTVQRGGERSNPHSGRATGDLKAPTLVGHQTRLEAIKASKVYRGWIGGYTNTKSTKNLSVYDLNWKRIGQFAVTVRFVEAARTTK